jgi:hypothetical protein
VPTFAAQKVFAKLDVAESVRAVFLIEDDEDQLYRNSEERGRGFELFSAEHQRSCVRRSWLHGQWLRQEAMRCSVPIVAPRPWETLAERILTAIE